MDKKFLDFQKNKYLFATFFLGIFTLITLSACTTPEERQAQQRQYKAQLQAKCDEFGFKRGTNAYAQCLQKADRDSIEDKRARNERGNCYIRQSQCYASGRIDCGAC
jgi:hypothetical protein